MKLHAESGPQESAAGALHLYRLYPRSLLVQVESWNYRGPLAGTEEATHGFSAFKFQHNFFVTRGLA